MDGQYRKLTLKQQFKPHRNGRFDPGDSSSPLPPPVKPDKVPADKTPVDKVHPKRPIKKSTTLFSLVDKADLFHDSRRNPYVSLEVASHIETWSLRSRTFEDYLCHQAYSTTGEIPSQQTIDDTIKTLSGRARVQAVTKDVFLRLAGHQGRIYLDLGDPDWRAIEVDADGWRILTRPPVVFRRPNGMAGLPDPVKGGQVTDLRSILNVGSDINWRMMVAWLLATLKPKGPYPILVLVGEQGSAKSTTAEGLRFLVDPHAVPLRSAPNDERDLAIAGHNNWLAAFDNLSKITPKLSDALCRMATGGGFGTRKLYSDDDEQLFSVERPVLVNGIAAEMVERPDLLERSIVLELPAVETRRTREEVWRELEAARPRLLGALLDAVSFGLKNPGTATIKGLPRMADFAVWVEACAPSLGWTSGSFLEAYRQVQREGEAHALSLWSVFDFINQVADRGGFEGTIMELNVKLDRMLKAARMSRPWDWPNTPRHLGSQLRRYAPNLRRVGILVEFGDKARSGRKVRIAKIPGPSPGPAG